MPCFKIHHGTLIQSKHKLRIATFCISWVVAARAGFQPVDPFLAMGLVNPPELTMSVGNNRLAEILKASLDPQTNKEGRSFTTSLPVDAHFCSGTRPVARGEEARLLCDPATNCCITRL